MKNQPRRHFIKTASLAVFGLSSSFSIFPSNVMAEEKSSMILSSLINYLRSTNDSVCETAATKLLALKGDPSSYDLHLRNADLKSEDIERISKSIKAIDDAGGPELHSFSMSYNPNLRDKGAVILSKNLPSTLTEIGLVGCVIGDKGADALLVLAQTTPKLHWLCVENNNLSNVKKQQLLKLGQQRNGLLVVV